MFNADRLIRLVVEEGLNLLPFSSCQVKTQSNVTCNGIRFDKGNCGVSIIRSGKKYFHDKFILIWHTHDIVLLNRIVFGIYQVEVVS